jgi:hypothetical protein
MTWHGVINKDRPLQPDSRWNGYSKVSFFKERGPELHHHQHITIVRSTTKSVKLMA